jgi:hypothetical protein
MFYDEWDKCVLGLFGPIRWFVASGILSSYTTTIYQCMILINSSSSFLPSYFKLIYVCDCKTIKSIISVNFFMKAG